MSLYHELGVQADIALRMVQIQPAGPVNRIHHHLIQLGGVNTRLTLNPACTGITASNCAVVEQQYLGIFLQALLLSPVNGHVGNDGAGRILGQFISLSHGIDLNHIVAVKRSFNDGTGLAETGLASADFTNRIIRFC